MRVEEAEVKVVGGMVMSDAGGGGGGADGGSVISMGTNLTSDAHACGQQPSNVVILPTSSNSDHSDDEHVNHHHHRDSHQTPFLSVHHPDIPLLAVACTCAWCCHHCHHHLACGVASHDVQRNVARIAIPREYLVETSVSDADMDERNDITEEA